MNYSLDKLNKVLKVLKEKNDPKICIFNLKFENNFGMKCNILDENGQIVYNNEDAYKIINKSVFFQIIDEVGKFKFINVYTGVLYINYNHEELNKIRI